MSDYIIADYYSMPYFPDLKALFLHIPKCGGKSVEAALLPPPLKANSGMRGPINLAARQFSKRTQSDVPHTYLLGTLDVVLSAQHLTYNEIEILGLLRSEAIKEAHIFATVRNPYSRALSSVAHFAQRFAKHYWLDPAPTPAQVERALEFWRDLDPDDHNLRAHRRAQTDFLLDRDGRLVTDRLMRLETIAEDFLALCHDLRIEPRRLTHSGKGRVVYDFNKLFTARSRKLVTEMFERDFILLNYCV